MPAVERVEFALQDDAGRRVGTLHLSSLKRSPTPDLFDDVATPGLERIQVVEHGEYRFEVEHELPGATISAEPREVFSFDTDGGVTGRLRTTLNTGRMAFGIRIGRVQCGELAIEVRSVKLSYEQDYRFMLGDIARVATDLVLRRFGAAEQRLEIEDTKDWRTVYQRFAFLRALLASDAFSEAMRRVLSAPFVEWQSVAEIVPSQRGLRGSGNIGRALVGAGERTRWEGAPHGLPTSLPRMLPRVAFVESVDNAPNRFVRHVLESWRTLVDHVIDHMEREKRGSERRHATPSGTTLRGIAEANDLALRLDDYLRHPLFETVGHLRDVPTANQVLQRREGYREVLEAYVQSLFAARLTWNGGERVYGAGQRDVATLYEYWCFLRLATLLEDVTGDRDAIARLARRTHSGDGFALMLDRGMESRVTFRCERGRSRLLVDLCFNREFRPSGIDRGTWTRILRPDYTLELAVQDAPLWQEPARLHFDAKYRADTVTNVLGAEEETATPESVLKMHTYRDAIVRAAGAYVLFPGDCAEVKCKHQEILPGIGAFPLVPTADEEASGTRALRRFLNQALDHIAAHATRDARARFWERTAHTGPANSARAPSERWLRAPPADTVVLLGYVKSEAHLKWIRTNGLYNLRADGRSGSVGLDAAELQASLVVLYGPALGERTLVMEVHGAPVLMTRGRMEAIGYPTARGDLYFCLPVTLVDQVDAVSHAKIDAIHKASSSVLGTPVATTWLRVRTDSTA